MSDAFAGDIVSAADVAEGCLPVVVAFLLLAEEEFGADCEFFVVRKVAQFLLEDLPNVAVLGERFGDGAVDAIVVPRNATELSKVA